MTAFLQVRGNFLSGQKRSFISRRSFRGREERRLFFSICFCTLSYSPSPDFLVLDKPFVLGCNLPFRSVHLHAERRGKLSYFICGHWIGRESTEIPKSLCSISLFLPLAPGAHTGGSVRASQSVSAVT